MWSGSLLRVSGVERGRGRAWRRRWRAPVRADMVGNAFLSALTNAGIAVPSRPATLALGQSVCPMLVNPGQSFDSVVSRNGRPAAECPRKSGPVHHPRDRDVLPGGDSAAAAEPAHGVASTRPGARILFGGGIEVRQSGRRQAASQRRTAAAPASGGAPQRGPRTEREAPWSGPGRARPAQPQALAATATARTDSGPPIPPGRRRQAAGTRNPWRTEHPGPRHRRRGGAPPGRRRRADRRRPGSRAESRPRGAGPVQQDRRDSRSRRNRRLPAAAIGPRRWPNCAPPAGWAASPRCSR